MSWCRGVWCRGCGCFADVEDRYLELRALNCREAPSNKFKGAPIVSRISYPLAVLSAPLPLPHTLTCN
eukprot:scaffold246023_cov30-Tisochrysis_lutea.AAC.1